MTSATGNTMIARQFSRLQTVRRALLNGQVEDRYRVLRFIVTRLPISETAKRDLLNRGLTRLLDRQQRSQRSQIELAQKKWDSMAQKRLDQLFATNETVEVPNQNPPKVSILFVTHNKAHLSLYSIESIARHCSVPLELIVVDNGSTDTTATMLERIKGAKIIRNPENLGFGPACMQGADVAAGEYLCLFNNDALLNYNAVESALRNFDIPGIGAVGGKILLANGRLQEAGSIIWSDGSALGYGRGDDPQKPQYNFRRPVDYCSAVFLMTPTQLFREAGGFSKEFAPAYYEDTDYCMTLWQRGLGVIYEPLAEINHYESASSGGNDNATAMMAAHQAKFKSKWSDALERHYTPAAANVCAARIAVNSPGLRIVCIDDRIPEKALGAGFPRSNAVVTALTKMGHHVTCSTSTFPVLDDSRADLPLEVEIFDGCRFRQKLVDEYLACADVVWVSRPHNLKLLWKEHRSALADRHFKLVYDAEAIFSQRVEGRAAVLGSATTPPSDLEPAGLDEEISLAKLADSVIVVCEADRQVMLQAGVPSVHVIGHSISISPTTNPFEARDAFLFVGSIHGLDSPNADSIRAFCRTHWADIHHATGAPLLVAGYGTELLRQEIRDSSVQFLGKVDDLRPLYERARIFVVPTRFAAGIPFKAHEAAGFGVPLVVSALIDRQMQWKHGTDYYVAPEDYQMAQRCIELFGDHELWERFRANALARVDEELSPASFTAALKAVLSGVKSTDR